MSERMKYISRDRLLEELEIMRQHYLDHDNLDAAYWYEDVADWATDELRYDESTVQDTVQDTAQDTVQDTVRHGAWKTADSSQELTKCSVCEAVFIINPTIAMRGWKYCPNCGAKMDAQEA